MMTWTKLGNRGAPWWFEVCDKDGVPQEEITDPQSLTFTKRHGPTPTGSITLPPNHPLAPLLTQPGARYRLRSTMDSEVISTGLIRGSQGQGSPGVFGGIVGTGTWNLVDDRVVLGDWLIHPPAGSAQDTRTGPAETVALQFISAAASRLAKPLIVLADQGRGGTVTLSGRYQPLSDVLNPAIANAGIGIRIEWDHNQATYKAWCVEPKTHPLTLTPESGAVPSWTWSMSTPTATRVLVAGPGEGADRVTREVIDAALEAATGSIREAQVDARDVKPAEDGRTITQVYADLDKRGAQALADAMLAPGLTLDLDNTPELGVGTGTGLNLGDILNTELIPGAGIIEAPISEIALSWTTDEGFTVTPTAGEITNPDRVITSRIAALAADARKQRSIG
ncbi:siphovirus ReqiPepy6 Gp37-like family protein [Ornithinimicrobium sp. Arc0846-15]|nr:siphovirus ReqiPepy6 Gp37-like family protein [Ornithinimicrobium laminariae]